MSFFRRLNSLLARARNLTKLVYYEKLAFKTQLSIGKNFHLKNTSRIAIWNNGGSIKIGRNCSIGYNTELYTWNHKLSIGDNTSINDNCKIYESVSIGANCLLASNIFISSGGHNFNYIPSLPIKIQDRSAILNKPIIIEDDCWIGFGVVIMPGVYIGKGAVIGSNAVVTKNIFPYSINAGIPAKTISKRLDFSHAFKKIFCTEAAHWPFFYRGIDYNQFEDLPSLQQGLSIVTSIAIFLVKKSVATHIEITGYCEQELDIEIFLNENRTTIVTLPLGRFDLRAPLTLHEPKTITTYDELSQELKDSFNIIILKKSDSSNVKTNHLKIRAIGLHENNGVN